MPPVDPKNLINKEKQVPLRQNTKQLAVFSSKKARDKMAEINQKLLEIDLKQSTNLWQV